MIIPGRTDFRFLRLSVMLCLEWALNRGRSRLDGAQLGIDTGEPRQFTSYADVWRAFTAQLDAMVERTVRHVVETFDDRSILAPVPLLSSLIDGCIENRRDMTAGGSRFRTFAMLAVTELGLGAVWIGAFDPKKMADTLGLPAGQIPVALLPIGYPNEIPERTTRRAIQDFVHELK